MVDIYSLQILAVPSSKEPTSRGLRCINLCGLYLISPQGFDHIFVLIYFVPIEKFSIGMNFIFFWFPLLFLLLLFLPSPLNPLLSFFLSSISSPSIGALCAHHIVSSCFHCIYSFPYF